jgi:sugar/nucleoside kinase (ribokinase family)
VDKYIHTGMMYPGGNALNFAVYASRLGAESAYLGVFGSDRAGHLVREAAQNEGVALTHCQTRKGENGFACVDLIGGDRRFVHSNKGGIAGREPMVLSLREVDYLSTFDLIVSSINSCMTDELPKMNLPGIPLAFDFSERHDYETLREFCPHLDYAVLSAGKLSLTATLAKVQQCHDLGATYVLATLGARGALFSNRLRYFLSPARKIAARDSLGAGDAYLTAFLLCHVSRQHKQGDVRTAEQESQRVRDCMGKGNALAALVCLQDGAFGYGTPISENLDNEKGCCL